MASAKVGFRLFVAGKCTAIGQNDVRKKSKKPKKKMCSGEWTLLL
jgi:hypothetical protein